MMKTKQPKQRNLLHNHPLLGKGGVHGKSKKAERRRDKQVLRKAWFSLSTHCVLREDHANICSIAISTPSLLPIFFQT